VEGGERKDEREGGWGGGEGGWVGGRSTSKSSEKRPRTDVKRDL